MPCRCVNGRHLLYISLPSGWLCLLILATFSFLQSSGHLCWLSSSAGPVPSKVSRGERLCPGDNLRQPWNTITLQQPIPNSSLDQTGFWQKHPEFRWPEGSCQHLNGRGYLRILTQLGASETTHLANSRPAGIASLPERRDTWHWI